MKNTMLILAAAAASAVSLHGQIQTDRKLIADVPFTFHQSGKAMPAGRYELKNGPTGTVVVANVKAHVKAVSIVGKQDSPATAKGFLRFACYGESNKCFLRAIAAPGSATLLTIGPDRTEKEYARYGTARAAYIGVERPGVAGQ